MPAVCFYFQVHQPDRINRFHFTNLGKNKSYFDDAKNALILDKVSRKCYLKTNKVLNQLIHQYQGKFRISYSISGVAIEQMKKFAPEVLESFQKLVDTGHVELINETFYHSLAALYDENEFFEQVEQHRKLIKTYFGKKPTTFRNTELIYNNHIGSLIHKMGYKTVLTEGADDILDWRSPCYMYKHPENDLRILTKNYKLSDDVAFRFSNRAWSEFPLRAETYANWIHRLSGHGEVVNLFMDYETFGEHQWEDTGIFNFLKQLPAQILQHPDWEFLTPSEVTKKYETRGELSFQRNVSWADTERDTSAWNSNRMQKKALAEIYALKPLVIRKNNSLVLQTWRKLLTSDHFYYMCTKFFADGDVHAYFSPFKSPYEAFLSYMAIVEDFKLYLVENKSREYSENMFS